MKALTLHQPWASLIAVGVKTIETRSWSTQYRGPLAIHAAMKRGAMDGHYFAADPAGDPQWHVQWDIAILYDCEFGNRVEMPLGAVVAICNLVDVVPVMAHDSYVLHTASFVAEYAHEGRLAHQRGGLWLIGTNALTHGTPTCIDDQCPYGDFTPGRYAWLLDNIAPLAEPVPVRGRQGLWNWSDAETSQ